MAASPLPAIAVLCSGQGTNVQAILEAVRCRRLKARMAVMITDNPAAPALERALEARVPAVVVAPWGYPSRRAYDRALARTVERYGARLVVLAGFMRILSPEFVRRFRGRILNVHPALLPAFPGAHAVRDALRAKAKVTGVTVHFVDTRVDHGPALLQGVVPVRPRDTEESLLARIHRLEHRLYPEAIQLALEADR